MIHLYARVMLHVRRVAIVKAVPSAALAVEVRWDVADILNGASRLEELYSETYTKSVSE